MANYKYIGPSNVKEEEKTFNQSAYQEFIKNGKYNDAADYLSKFMPTGPDAAEKDKERIQIIREMRYASFATQNYYNNIQNSEDRADLEFLEATKSIGGYRQEKNNYINKYGSSEGFNKYHYKTARAMEIIDDIAGGSACSTMRITFPTKKVGVLGIDFLKKDVNDINAFYDNLKGDDKYLKAHGVHVSKDDRTGDVTLTLSKNNELLNNILLSIPRRYNKDNMPIIEGYDQDGNKLRPKEYNRIYTVGPMLVPNSDMNTIYEYQSLYKSAEDTRMRLSAKPEMNRQRSSTLFTLDTDALSDLDAAYSAGLMKEEVYKDRYKKTMNIVNAVKTSGSYDYYSNYNGGDEGNPDNTLRLVTGKDKTDLYNLLTSINPKDMEILGQVSNGQIGIHVTINDKSKKGSATTKDKTTDGVISIFIPGLLTEELQARMNSDTELRSQLYYNTLVDTDGGYTNKDGMTLSIDRYGLFYLSDTKGNSQLLEGLTKEEAIQFIHEDMLETDGELIKYNYTNANNELDINSFTEKAKEYAVAAANELFPTVNLGVIDPESNGKLNFTRLFSTEFQQNYRKYCKGDTARKIEYIMKIYSYLMQDAARFSQQNNK